MAWNRELYEKILSMLVFFVVEVFVVKPLRIPIKGTEWKVPVNYSTAPPAGVLLLLACQVVKPVDVRDGIIGVGDIKPYSVVLVLFSLAYLCLSLDLSGFFGFLALKSHQASGTSGRLLFLSFFLMTAFITMFTSNGVAVLTMTPIVTAFAASAGLPPDSTAPYLFANFFAANLFCMMLFTNNTVNIIVAQAEDMGFHEFTGWTALPTLVSGTVLFLLLLGVFWRRIPEFIVRSELLQEMNDAKRAVAAAAAVPLADPNDPNAGGDGGDVDDDGASSVNRVPGEYNKLDAALGILWLAATLTLLIASHWMPSVPIWAVSLGLAGTKLLRDAATDVYRYTRALQPPTESVSAKLAQIFPTCGEALARMPWKALPFVFSMFTLVQCFSSVGWIDVFADGLAKVVTEETSPAATVFFMGFLTTIAANVLNNQPMTILFTQIFHHPHFRTHRLHRECMFSLLVGANLGADLTPYGSLAGIMWQQISSRAGVRMSYLNYVRWSLLIIPPVLAAALGVLTAEMYIIDNQAAHQPTPVPSPS